MSSIMQLPTNPTLENLSLFITKLGKLDGLTDQTIDGIPTQDCIKFLFEHIQSLTKTENGGELDVHQLEYDFVHAVTKALLNRRRIEGVPRLQPKEAQVGSIQRIVFRRGDTILIAWPGYGKTLVLHTVPFIMQDKVTISLCTIKQRGEDQFNTVRQIPGLRPLLINGDTKKDDHMWSDLTQGRYNHVIISPEELTHDPFLKLLRNPTFNQKIAFVAIDDLHTVYDWQKMHITPKIGKMRALLPKDVPWFGCTATLSKKTEKYVLTKAGFRPKGDSIGELCFIQTTVDRPNISIVVQPLVQGKRPDFRRLRFLLDGIKPKAPRDIEKTIVYMNELHEVVGARQYLMSEAQDLGLSPSQAESLIRNYHADIRPNDRQLLYDNFVQEDSPCRIMVVCPPVIDLDVPDVKRVVQFGQIASGDLADLWRRFGRAVRDGKTQGKAFFFPPYWYFDRLGPLGDTEWGSIETPNLNDGPVVDAELGQFGVARRGYWMMPDRIFRADLRKAQPDIYGFVNAKCFRKYALEFLQESTDDGIEDKTVVSLQLCCNGCHHELGRISKVPPRLPFGTQPEEGTKAWFAWQEINAFCEEQVNKAFAFLGDPIRMPGCVLMQSNMQWEVAKVCDGIVAPDKIAEKVRDILRNNKWDFLEEFGDMFCTEALVIQRKAMAKYKGHLEAQERDKKAKRGGYPFIFEDSEEDDYICSP